MANLAALRRIGRSADPRFDRRVALVLAGSVAAGLAELLSIGAVAPLVGAALGGGSTWPRGSRRGA